MSSIGLQVRQPAIGGGRIPFAGRCRSSTFQGRVRTHLRHCSPVYGHCHDEHDDLQSPRRKSQMPPVDIGCVAFDSQEPSCCSTACDKVPCTPVYLKTHKVRVSDLTIRGFSTHAGGCPGDVRRTNALGRCSSTKVDSRIHKVLSSCRALLRNRVGYLSDFATL